LKPAVKRARLGFLALAARPEEDSLRSRGHLEATVMDVKGISSVPARLDEVS
jgi:hypothetical protein